MEENKNMTQENEAQETKETVLDKVKKMMKSKKGIIAVGGVITLIALIKLGLETSSTDAIPCEPDINGLSDKETVLP